VAEIERVVEGDDLCCRSGKESAVALLEVDGVVVDGMGKSSRRGRRWLRKTVAVGG